jgi:hypothetical protein
MARFFKNIHFAMVKFLKTLQNNSFDPPAHPKRQFDLLRGNLDTDVTPIRK